MITAVDANILLDVLAADPDFGIASKEAVRNALAWGKLVACEIVWAEVGAFFPSQDDALDAFQNLGVEYSPMDVRASLMAGVFWKKYRKAGGIKNRIISDFLIGAHALSSADKLLTRDRGFFHRYFSGLKILDPST